MGVFLLLGELHFPGVGTHVAPVSDHPGRIISRNNLGFSCIKSCISFRRQSGRAPVRRQRQHHGTGACCTRAVKTMHNTMQFAPLTHHWLAMLQQSHSRCFPWSDHFCILEACSYTVKGGFAPSLLIAEPKSAIDFI